MSRRIRFALAAVAALAVAACAKKEQPPAADTTVATAVLVATPDTSGWVMELSSKVKVKNHVTFSGDGVTVKSEPYASMRRKGKQVWSESVYRLENGKLVGLMVAHYAKSGADSVLRLKAEGTKQ